MIQVYSNSPWFVAFPLMLATALSGSQSARPNILFIMSDDHAAHAIGAYGSRVNETPHLDQLAKEGDLTPKKWT
jgi:hypothetical protein